MTTRDEPRPDGTPCWIDLMSTDPAASAGFYSSLFGWEVTVGPPETYEYRTCSLRGRQVAGIGAVPQEQQTPTVWTTYLSVGDIDAYAEKVAAAQGQVLMGPTDIFAEGRMAIAMDPTGAVFGMWQPGNHFGARLVEEPGTLTWSECMSPGYGEALAFYREVFGYRTEEIGDGTTFQYSVLNLADSAVGGVGALPMDKGDALPHWLVYFATDDTDATTAAARDLGGQVGMEPTDSPQGRLAVLGGPHGEVFAVINPVSR